MSLRRVQLRPLILALGPDRFQEVINSGTVLLFPVSPETKQPFRDDWQTPGAPGHISLGDLTALLNSPGASAYGWDHRRAFIVLDVDTDTKSRGRDGITALAKLAGDFGLTEFFARAPFVATANGGRHYYFTIPDGVDWSKYRTEDPDTYWGVELRHPGVVKYVVGPGSRMANGKEYNWVLPDGRVIDVASTDSPLVVEFPRSLLPVFEIPAITASPRDSHEVLEDIATLLGTAQGDTFQERAETLLKRMLEPLDPCDFNHNDAWFEVMAAYRWVSDVMADVVDEAEGSPPAAALRQFAMTVFDEWSAGDALFSSAKDAHDRAVRWKSLHSQASEREYRVGTLIHLTRIALLAKGCTHEETAQWVAGVYGMRSNGALGFQDIRIAPTTELIELEHADVIARSIETQRGDTVRYLLDTGSSRQRVETTRREASDYTHRLRKHYAKAVRRYGKTLADKYNATSMVRDRMDMDLLGTVGSPDIYDLTDWARDIEGALRAILGTVSREFSSLRDDRFLESAFLSDKFVGSFEYDRKALKERYRRISQALLLEVNGGLSLDEIAVRRILRDLIEHNDLVAFYFQPRSAGYESHTGLYAFEGHVWTHHGTSLDTRNDPWVGTMSRRAKEAALRINGISASYVDKYVKPEKAATFATHIIQAFQWAEELRRKGATALDRSGFFEAYRDIRDKLLWDADETPLRLDTKLSAVAGFDKLVFIDRAEGVVRHIHYRYMEDTQAWQYPVWHYLPTLRGKSEDCPNFDRYAEELTKAKAGAGRWRTRPESIRLLYAIIANGVYSQGTIDNKVYFLRGPGNTGKTTLSRVLSEIFGGNYNSRPASETFDAGGVRFSSAERADRLVVNISEIGDEFTGKNKSSDDKISQMLKILGQDRQVAQVADKREKARTVRATSVALLDCNTLPSMTVMTEAERRRMCVLEIVSRPEDRSFSEADFYKLGAEYPAVLNKALRILGEELQKPYQERVWTVNEDTVTAVPRRDPAGAGVERRTRVPERLADFFNFLVPDPSSAVMVPGLEAVYLEWEKAGDSGGPSIGDTLRHWRASFFPAVEEHPTMVLRGITYQWGVHRQIIHGVRLDLSADATFSEHLRLKVREDHSRRFEVNLNLHIDRLLETSIVITESAKPPVEASMLDTVL